LIDGRKTRQKWYGPISLKNLEALDRWLEVVLYTEARQALGDFREVERKRREGVLVIVVSVRSSSVRSAPLRFIIVIFRV